MTNRKYFITCDLESTTDKLNFGIDTSQLKLQPIRSRVVSLLQECLNAPVDMIQTNDIVKFFDENLVKEDEFLISLDNGIYLKNANFYYDSTRTYLKEDDIINNPKDYRITQRNGEKTQTQLQELVKKFRESNKQKVVICDDGIFSGDTLYNTIEDFKKLGLPIDKITVVLNFSNQDNLKGIPIQAMKNIPQDLCIDWIDERDFFYGTPMSGASVKDWNNMYGVPYISERKIAEKKASIPRNKSKDFCINMITENQRLREGINSLRGKNTSLVEVKRISNLLKKYGKQASILDILQKEKDLI